MAIAAAILLPLAIAARSPLLAWRDPVYILAGFAGVLALGLLLLQPLLAAGRVPGLVPFTARRIHRVIGLSLLAAVVLHVAGLWITSPPDVVDALLFVSPTPFSVWGVIAMWAVFATAVLASFRRKWRLRWRVWRIWHLSFGVIIVSGTILHALLIEGTMGTWSKAALCVLVAAATVGTVFPRRVSAKD